MKGVLLLLVAVTLLCSCGKSDFSYGVIGGADGPTAIIVGEQKDVLKDLPTKTYQGDGSWKANVLSLKSARQH